MVEAIKLAEKKARPVGRTRQKIRGAVHRDKRNSPRLSLESDRRGWCLFHSRPRFLPPSIGWGSDFIIVCKSFVRTWYAWYIIFIMGGGGGGFRHVHIETAARETPERCLFSDVSLRGQRSLLRAFKLY